MAEFLDPNKNNDTQVKIVYRTVMQQRPWYIDLAKILIVIVVAVTVVWGISRADEVQQTETTSEAQPFSISGFVSATTPDLLSIDNARSSAEDNPASYTFDMSTIQKIETNMDVLMQFSDIRAGDHVVVQGTFVGTTFTAVHVVDFTSTPNSTTTTTTTEKSLASTTPDISTSTNDVASSTSSSTPTFFDNVFNAVGGTVQNIINIFTGTTTPPATTTDEAATTAPEVVQDTPPPVINTSTTTP